MKIVRMTKGDWGKVVAFFDVSAEGIVIKGFKLVQGADGMFVGSPSQKGKDNEYHDTVYMEKEVRAELYNLANAKYHDDSDYSAPKSGKKAEVVEDDIPF